MSKWLNTPALALLCLLCGACDAWAQSAAPNYPGLGRTATAREIAAWDIDVRADFKGLPKGSGSVAQGQDVWEAKCASCHGVFGESNEVFNPVVGGVTAKDVASGRVANLARDDYPSRTTMMKLATLSTLWDYINRAMPWNAPKSLSTNEVYAVVAFMLNLSEVVPDNFVLSDQNIAQVQQRMPNRLGMQTDHALWPGREWGSKTTRPDTANTACMKNCATDPHVASLLPDFARNAHGNLRDQNRLVGPQRGANTLVADASAATSAASTGAVAGSTPAAAPGNTKAVLALLGKHNCTACHGVERKIVGPALTDVAKKYPDQADTLAQKIKNGGSGVWGSIPMPAQNLPVADAQAIAAWLARGAPR
jgi:S-disulfanyl-L-cysteine oxidoreductase SoxD